MTDADSTPDPIRAARRELAASGVSSARAAAVGEVAGDQIERYKLLQEIGEGGMGTVWMAEQSEPVRRKVALKIIKLGMGAGSLARQRNSNVEKLQHRLRGDLDWIVMKAISKDRTRRYETASGFAEDVRRFLDNEPVLAAPPSVGYRLRKMYRRRRKTVAAAVTIVALLIAGSIGTGLGWWNVDQANRALNLALEERSVALRSEAVAKGEALRNEARAKDEAELARLAQLEAQQRADELRRVAAFQKSRIDGVDPQRMGALLRASLLEAMPGDRREALEGHLSALVSRPSRSARCRTTCSHRPSPRSRPSSAINRSCRRSSCRSMPMR
jgi:hypothetical protein